VCIPLTCGEPLGLFCLVGDTESEEHWAGCNRLAVTGEAIKLCLSNLRLQAKREQATRIR
jgi:hypothetical protein